MLLKRCFNTLASKRMLFNVPNYSENCNLWRPRQTCVAKILYTTDSRNFNYKDKKKLTETRSVSENCDPGDVLLQQLQNTKSTAAVVQLLESRHWEMNRNHVLLAFETFNLNRRIENVSSKKLINSRGFEELCQQTVNNISTFTVEDTIKIFKFIAKEKVPGDTLIFKAVIDILLQSSNSFSLQQILFLERMLVRSLAYSAKKQNVNSTINSIREFQKKLTIMFNNVIEEQLQENDLDMVIFCWIFVLKYKVKTLVVEKLLQIILTNVSDLTEAQNVALFIEISKLKPREAECHNHLMRLIIRNLCDIIMNLNVPQTRAVIARYTDNPHNVMKNEKLLRILSHKAVLQNWDLVKMSLLLEGYNRSDFVSEKILDQVARKIDENPEVLLDNRVSILSIVEAFSTANYLPSGSKDFLNHIINCKHKISVLEKYTPHGFVKFVAHLVILGVANSNLLERVLNPGFASLLMKFSTEDYESVLQHHRIIDMAAKLDFKGYKGPFLDESPKVLKECTTNKPNKALKNYLEQGFDGSHFVLDGLWTRFGHFIDHLIVLRKGDIPVAFLERGDGEQIQYVEDITIPPDAKLLAVLVAKPGWFPMNSSRPVGFISFLQRTLDQLHYTSVILNPTKIDALLDREKLPYIMREINLALKKT